MSQSWDNVANMQELFTVSSRTQRKSVEYYLPSCMSTVSTVLLQQYELWTCYCVDHPSKARCRSTVQQLLELTTAIATFSLCSNVESTTRAWQRIDLVSRFAWGSVACWAGLLKRAALRTVHSRMRRSLWSLLFVHTALQYWPIIDLLNL